MELSGPAKRLTAYVGESDTYEDRSLSTALLEAARKAGCAGATVLTCGEGFGATSRLHSGHDLRMSKDLPVLVVVVDAAHRVAALSEVWAAMVGDGLLTIDDCEVVLYRGGVTGGPRGD
jgi:PII-like signaling protein